MLLRVGLLMKTAVKHSRQEERVGGRWPPSETPLKKFDDRAVDGHKIIDSPTCVLLTSHLELKDYLPWRPILLG